MTQKELICISCPLGCQLTITLDGASIQSIAGNTCPKGESYAKKELTNPTRTVTSTVRVSGSTHLTVSVKTASEVPKFVITQVMQALKPITVSAPIAIGDVILSNVANTGVDIVATSRA